MVDGGDEGGDFGLVAVDLDAPGKAPADGDPLQLLGQLHDALHVAALQRIEHEDQSGDEGEQEAQQPDDRHLRSSYALRLGIPRAPGAL